MIIRIHRSDAKPAGPLVVLPPNRLEAQYRNRLIKRLRKLAGRTSKVIKMLLSTVGDELDMIADLRTDSTQSISRQITDTFAKLQIGWNPTQDELSGLAADMADTVSGFNKRQVGRVAANLLSVDPIINDPGLKAVLRKFEDENLKLIVNMEQRLLDQTKDEILGAVRAGKRAGDLEGIIRDRLKVGESRAKLIARDQIATLNGQLTERRQTELGFTHYEWQTSEDERVREEHEALNGDIIAWANPPSDGHPGIPINCRCVALPVVAGDPRLPQAGDAPKTPEVFDRTIQNQTDKDIAGAGVDLPVESKETRRIWQEKFPDVPLTASNIKRLSGGETKSVTFTTTKVAGTANNNLAVVVESDKLKMHRVFRTDVNGDLIVKHVSFFVDKKAQGQGIGREFLRNQILGYQELGVTKITTDAAEVGQYVWPSMGFRLKDPLDLLDLKDELISLHKTLGITKEQAQRVANSVNSIHELSISTIGGKKVGKDFLLESRLGPFELELNLKGPEGDIIRKRLGIGK